MKDPKIVEINSKKMIGAKIRCSVANDKTGVLWQNFMPKRKQIQNRTNSDYYSIQNYDSIFDLESFTEETEFEKWAAVEVSEYAPFPEGLETLELKGGKYAVFIHHGLSSEFSKTMQYIFESWLPQSGFKLDDRPHFDVMGSKYYGPSDANSEEEIWVPIK